MTPSTSPTEQAEIYPRAFRSIGEFREKQMRGLFSGRLLLLLPPETHSKSRVSSLFRVIRARLRHPLFLTSKWLKILGSYSQIYDRLINTLLV